MSSNNINTIDYQNQERNGGDKMRMKLIFELEKPELDIDYRKSLISFIKHSLEEYDKELYNSLYEKGKTTKKTYTFATILNRSQI